MLGSHTTSPKLQKKHVPQITQEVRVRPRYSEPNRSESEAARSRVLTTGFAAGSGPVVRSTALSIMLTTASASAWRPLVASQRGDSGSSALHEENHKCRQCPNDEQPLPAEIRHDSAPTNTAATNPKGNTSS